jgi:capsule biosynthesis phosphatase
MRICFDLDGTLVTAPAVPGDYSTVQPIPDRIALAQKLKAQGHTIIIYTARKMRTHGGNVGKVIAEVGLVTLRTITDFGIPCDELYFGKPEASYYVDDLAINAEDSTRLQSLL